MSDRDKTDSETLGGVLINGIGGRESPAVGVSGGKPLVNGDLRDGEGDGEYVSALKDSGSSATADIVAVKHSTSSSSVSLIVSTEPTKPNIPASSKPRTSLTHHSRQQHRLPPLNYYRYVPLPTHQPAPVFYPSQPQAYLGVGPLTGGGQLSSTNLYIRGLSERCCDEDLIKMCQQYGKIVSTKAILDKQTNICKGYGFVDFENPVDAMKAVQSLQTAGIMAQFAKQQEQDPTNLYFSNLPKSYDEKSLEALVAPYGTIVSTRILRDQTTTISRGVGFVRLDSKESCDKTIEMLNGTTLLDSTEPLMVKFADSSSNKKRQHGTGRWRDLGDYVYDAPHLLAPNGLFNSRVVQQGMLPSPYVQTPAHPMSGYQVPVSQAMTTGTWQPTYYVQPSTQTALSASSGVEGVASQLSSHLNHLHLSTSSSHYSPSPSQHTAYHSGGGGGHQQPTYQLGAAAQGGAHYTAQQTPGGWTFSHTHIMPQQDHVSDIHTGGSESKGHIQVLAADHTSSLGKEDPQTQQQPIHLYYPSSSWVAK